MFGKFFKFGFLTLFISSKGHSDEINRFAKKIDGILLNEKVVTLKFFDKDGFVVENLRDDKQFKNFNENILSKMRRAYIIEKNPDSITLRIHEEGQEIDFAHINERIIIVNLDSVAHPQPSNIGPLSQENYEL